MYVSPTIDEDTRQLLIVCGSGLPRLHLYNSSVARGAEHCVDSSTAIGYDFIIGRD